MGGLWLLVLVLSCHVHQQAKSVSWDVSRHQGRFLASLVPYSGSHFGFWCLQRGKVCWYKRPGFTRDAVEDGRGWPKLSLQRCPTCTYWRTTIGSLDRRSIGLVVRVCMKTCSKNSNVFVPATFIFVIRVWIIACHTLAHSNLLFWVRRLTIVASVVTSLPLVFKSYRLMQVPIAHRFCSSLFESTSVDVPNAPIESFF